MDAIPTPNALSRASLPAGDGPGAAAAGRTLPAGPVAAPRAPAAAPPGAPGTGGADWLATAGAPRTPAWTVAPGAGRTASVKGGRGWATAPGKPSAARTAPPARPLPKGSTPTPSPTPSRSPAPSKLPAPARTEASPSGEWAFLSDPNLSIEDKLFKFMLLVQKKTDRELVEKMEDYRAKHVTGSGSSSRSSGSGFLGFLKAVFPPAGIVDKLLGGDGGPLVQALQRLGGPLLAGLVTAVGLPALAPAALKLGDEVAGALLDGGSKGSSKSDKKESGTPDERLSMLEIQRLVDKQNQMFSLVSNLLKGMHETGMGVVNNLR